MNGKRTGLILFNVLAGISCTCFIIFVGSGEATAKKKEKDYQAEWCPTIDGEQEHVLPDRTRVDCLTTIYAVEIDFARKWPEGIGQALYYGLQTGKTPGVALILRGNKDYKYWLRMNSTIDAFNLPIKTWKIEG